MTFPKISLVTPTLNQAGFLPQMLDSIIRQDYPNLEHIVVDAMSTDSTPRILESYASRPGVRIIREPDNGQSDGINKGTRAATGEIASWLNSDDLLCPGALDQMAGAFIKNPGATVICGTGAKVDREGNLIRWVPYRPFNRQHLRTALQVIQPAIFYKRNIFLEVGGLDCSLNYAMDWDLLIRLARNREVISIPDKIAQLRMYEETKTSSGGWDRMREIGMLGRRHNGILDWNYLSLSLRNLVIMSQSNVLRRVVDAFFWQISRHTPLMVSGWPA